MEPKVFQEIKDALDTAQVFAVVYQGKEAVLVTLQEDAAKKKADALAVMAKQNEAAKTTHDATVARAREVYDTAVSRAQDAFNAATAEGVLLIAAAQEEVVRAETELQEAQRSLKEKYGIDVGASAVAGGSTRL